MGNKKMITAEMTNSFFELIWCDSQKQEKLLKQTFLVPRPYFNNTNMSNTNLVLKFRSVNKIKN